MPKWSKELTKKIVEKRTASQQEKIDALEAEKAQLQSDLEQAELEAELAAAGETTTTTTQTKSTEMSAEDIAYYELFPDEKPKEND